MSPQTIKFEVFKSQFYSDDGNIKKSKKGSIALTWRQFVSLEVGVCCRLWETIGLFMTLVVALSRQEKAYTGNS